MKKALFALLFALAFISCKAQNTDELIARNAEVDTFKILQPTKLQGKINKVITTILTRAHYKKFDLNDELSSLILDNYLKSLDYSRLYFLQSDIDEIEKYRFVLDDSLKVGGLTPAFEIYNLYKTRLNQRVDYILSELETEFDYSIDEMISIDRSEAEWAKSTDEVNDLWRKRLKNDALNRKLNDTEWEKISDNLATRYKSFHKRMLQLNEEDVFQLYMNAFGEAIEPHTSYMAPITAENFGINMSLSLEGIGAQLTFRNDKTTIVRIIPGGPADKSGKLNIDDKIVGVAQDDDEEFVDVVGWRLDDVIKLIRGKKGTKVRLLIEKGDEGELTKPFELALVRDKIKLEDEAAKHEIIEIKEDDKNYSLGVIKIPGFYMDHKAKAQGDPNYKSTTGDVRKLIDSLKAAKVDGVIIDLRRNGGGSLQEAVELTGLFIPNGPVVQVKNTTGGVEVLKDPDPNVVYDGPLAVIVGISSASASEIFSAAIQDYGRGIILGSDSFGKGTVQQLYGLNRFIPSIKENAGQLKLTLAKFYRINGESTQKKGVSPDISFPSAHNQDKYGEASRPTALPWDEIQTSDYTAWGNIAQYIPELLKKHEERIKSSNEFQYYLEDVNDAIASREKKTFSLREDLRKAELDEREAKREAREEERKKHQEIELEGDEEVTTQTTQLDDAILEESAHILANLITMKIG